MNDENDFDRSNSVSTSGVSGDIISPNIIQPQTNTTVPDGSDNRVTAAPELNTTSAETANRVPITDYQKPNFASEMTSPAAPDMNPGTNFNLYAPSQDASPVVQATPVESADTSATGPMAAPASTAQSAPLFMQQNSEMVGQVNNLPKKKRGLKTALIAIFTVVLLSGVGAGAYFGYILPNNPENKLGLSLLNALTNKQGTVSGKIDLKSKTKNNLAVALDYSLKSNDKGDASLSGNLGIVGTSFPFETIYLDKDIYLKVGGLNAIASMLPDAKLSGLDFSKLSDTWYVINRSLLQSNEQASCALETNTVLSENNKSKLKDAYTTHPLFQVESSSSEKLDGQSVTKMVIKPTSSDESAKFFKELENLEIYKQVKKCLGDSADSLQSSIDEEVNPDDAKKVTTSMTVYIGKGNQLKKIEIMGSDDESDANIDMNFDWSPVKITKPEGAKPIQEILSALDLNALDTQSDLNSGLDLNL